MKTETKVLYVGLDVDDKNFSGHRIAQDEKGVNFVSKPTKGSLVKKLKKFKELGYSEIKICYEAGYLGYSLNRDLQAEGFSCDVIAPSLIPTKPGEKVKTNRLDAQRLAEYYMKGELTVVHVPDEEEETIRDLIRSRKFLKEQHKQLKLHIVSLCRRMGWDYRQEREKNNVHYWTKQHVQWLESRIEGASYHGLKMNLTLLMNQLHTLASQINLYEDEIRRISQEGKYQKAVKALCCYRGIDVLNAMGIIVEIGDIHRFSHPRKLTSYVGMDIIEYSTGAKELKYKITKMGNWYLRTGIVESCQCVSRRPAVSKVLRRRREGVDSTYIEIADRCMKRLYKKSSQLSKREKHTNKIKVACARETLGFIWETLRAVA